MLLDLLGIGTLIALIQLLGVLAAFHAIRHARTSQGAVAWAVSLVAVPYVTLIPYLFLGHSRFTGYVRARRLCNQLMHRRAQQKILTRALDLEPEHGKRTGYLNQYALAALTQLAQKPFSDGNQVRILINGAATFAAIFAALERATQYVMVQFFIVRDDRLGRQLKDILLDKAAAGVRVYFLYDGIGSHELPRHYTESLRAGGVEVYRFAARRFVNRFQLNFRNHRKLVVVDGERAFVGGHNVGIEYLGEEPPLAPWRDTHIEVLGPAVHDLQAVFIEDWYWATQRVPVLEPSRPCAPLKAEMHCLVIPSGPADPYETCLLFFIELINAARQRVWISTPYFVPDEALFVALRLAVMRGLDVRILLPARSDHTVVFEASTLYAYDAVRAGVKLLRYRPGFLHQKVVLIDEAAAAIGSANLDNRSFRLNFELMVLTLDATFAAEVSKMLEADFALADAVALAEYIKLPPWRRTVMHVARLFSPLL
ncbi:cardiolipin synthetase [Mycoavidus cysteinexigens]|uniref:Cardiolipin synthase n=1 Tax=Mycoavidus cysteinexigens TaxID=1553431 RepID=A0A2Z6EUT0_9BURK|nr:cardiolipin synthase [Mycoavidus cysteinexigens]BBE09204.1 cardiolipin synthetase [Mycoavidus cysteinexigens]GAM52043.1 cardiolipin synthetase [bacterium endosymbiont of Mortierella elongata FMR23-6]GLR02151.1 cardiolipin synthase A [Mycoavidus cysteinexigens]